MLGLVYVRGEASNVKYHSSGHIYFTLKDEKSAIACVMFSRDRRGLKFHMQEGMQVVVAGSVEVYERDGKYQVYAKEIREEGKGDLSERFEALKQRLEEMGLFAAEYKQPIPRYIKRLGVVTASTGAAIQDIINITRRRNPYVEIILYPAIVQGDAAPASIVKGIETLDRYGVDTIIVGRGGGSMEDLFCFNDEQVAHAIFNCMTPIISAVGHETDFTIADFVADLRAPTPSAAAELSVYEYKKLQESILEKRKRLSVALMRKVERKRHSLERMKLRLTHLSPEQRIKEKRMHLLSVEDKLLALMKEKVTREKHRLALLTERLRAGSPLEKLNSGYGYITSETGEQIKDIRAVKKGDSLKIDVKNGTIDAVVTKVSKRSMS